MDEHGRATRLANLLAKMRVVWAEIPHGLVLSVALHCAVTLLAGVRAIQVLLHHNFLV